MSLQEDDRFSSYQFVPNGVNYFRIPIFEHFHGRPYHRRIMRQEWDTKQLCKDYSKHVLRSDIAVDPESPEADRQEIQRVLLQLDEEVFCHIHEKELLVYAPTPELADKTLTELHTKYGKPLSPEPTMPRFYLITSSHSGLGTEVVQISSPFVMNEDDLRLHYGPDAAQFEQKLTTALGTQVGGTTILRGVHGTGKTCFIRHLIGKLSATHRFYYLPMNVCRFLAEPDVIGFWLRQSRLAPNMKRVVVLEDAEDLLMQRDADNRKQASLLLNVADGLLGDFLRLHLLCTINCRFDEVDSAVTRPGRLLAYREFNRLNRSQAEQLAAAKQIRLPEQADYSLAEIYRQPVVGRPEKDLSKRQVGFTT